MLELKHVNAWISGKGGGKNRYLRMFLSRSMRAKMVGLVGEKGRENLPLQMCGWDFKGI